MKAPASALVFALAATVLAGPAVGKDETLTVEGIASKMGATLLLFENVQAYEDFDLSRCRNIAFLSEFDAELAGSDGKLLSLELVEVGMEYARIRSQTLGYVTYRGRPVDIWCDDERLFELRRVR